MCIIMFVATFILATTLGATLAGYAGSSSNEVGNGYGYGYSGSYSGTGSNIAPPNFPPIEFGNFLNGYFDSLRKYHEHFLQNRGPYSYAFTSASASPSASATSNARVEAMSSIKFFRNDRIQQQVQQLAAQNAEYAAGFPGSENVIKSRFGDNGAVASASIGPQGGYQTAAVFPENPNAPNIFSRFADTAQGGKGGDGSYSVFTSSVSSSGNADGKPYHRASTTINDNGKVSTYTVQNP